MCGAPAPPRKAWATSLYALAVDLSCLASVLGLVIVLTALARRVDLGDLRFHLVFFVFLLPGWCCCAPWARGEVRWADQFALTCILSFGLFGWMSLLAWLLGFGFDLFYGIYALVVVLSMVIRWWQLCCGACLRRPSIDFRRLAVWLVLGWFVAVVWRAPLSNDIRQFLLQQFDMAQHGTLAPSNIGMTAWNIEQPMPRWNAHLFHVWFSLVGVVAQLPIEGILRRWGTIPFAVVSLTTLYACIRSHVGKRVAIWAIAIAVLGPITLWFRMYNPFLYGFRLLNNFALDKDFALFFVLPAWLMMVHRACKSWRWFAWLVLLIPAVLKFHPMTAVYLFLLLPFVIIANYSPGNRVRLAAACLLVISLCVASMLTGDAQSFHEQIEQLVEADYLRSQSGRPLHYWIGHYAVWPEIDQDLLSTTRWRSGSFVLRHELILECGLLLVAHIAWVGWGLLFLLRPRRRRVWLRADTRLWVAGGAVLATLWCILLASQFFLDRWPFLYRGYERLHWFAYVPAMIVIAAAAHSLTTWLAVRVASKTRPTAYRWQRRATLLATTALLLHLADQSWHYATGTYSLLHRLPYLHSQLDFNIDPQRAWRPPTFSPADPPVARPPSYLRDDDRVLLLQAPRGETYWQQRHAVWWDELYGEAFALAARRPSFLADRAAFYDTFDLYLSDEAVDWIRRQGVTVVVDQRPASETFVQSLGRKLQRPVRQVAPNAWRIE